MSENRNIELPAEGELIGCCAHATGEIFMYRGKATVSPFRIAPFRIAIEWIALCPDCHTALEAETMKGSPGMAVKGEIENGSIQKYIAGLSRFGGVEEVVDMKDGRGRAIQ